MERSLCEAERPSDLKVSPFDTMRPPDVCCWRHPRDREKEERRWRKASTVRNSEKNERDTERETMRNSEKH